MNAVRFKIDFFPGHMHCYVIPDSFDVLSGKTFKGQDVCVIKTLTLEMSDGA